ncbi:MAG TPA: radical SAM protein [Acidimicrobiales bacterium]
MRVLLVSTYELGRQPVHLAVPAAALRARGHEVRTVDLAVDDWDPAVVDDVDALAVSVTMHTAARLANDVAASTKARRPALPRLAYGLYAGQTTGFDATIAGEYLPTLIGWVGGEPVTDPAPLVRTATPVPDRSGLPPVDRYAHLLVDGETRLAGAVEASRGCASRCRHCPVPVVYDGRTRIVDPDVVLADVDALVAAGARHITFGDPDFLNAVHHSMRVARGLHARHPDVTFDITTKVELILRHRGLWDELAALGCLFTVTALECVDDEVLAILDKGHTAAQAAEAVAVVRAAGIDVRPSLLPFTPWTTLEGLVALIDFVAIHDLAANVEPVHWTIRLLVPTGSLLLDRPELAPHLAGYDPAQLGHRWIAADPRVDELHARLVPLVEGLVAEEASPVTVFRAVAAEVRNAAGLDPALGVLDEGSCRPRLSEAWFCCAEPTDAQLGRVSLLPPVRR